MALQLKMAAEGKALLEKSLADKTLPTNDRNNRLVTLANTRVAENAKNAAQTLAAANSAKEGDGLVAIGEDMIGQGKAKEAITIIEAGIAKGVKDMANAQIRLGSAYLAAGQKPQALRAFQAAAAAKGDEKTKMVAQLYVTLRTPLVRPHPEWKRAPRGASFSCVLFNVQGAIARSRKRAGIGVTGAVGTPADPGLAAPAELKSMRVS